MLGYMAIMCFIFCGFGLLLCLVDIAVNAILVILGK